MQGKGRGLQNIVPVLNALRTMKPESPFTDLLNDVRILIAILVSMGDANHFLDHL